MGDDPYALAMSDLRSTRLAGAPTLPTLGETLGSRDNALNLVRLVLAAAVVIGHAAPVMGRSAAPEVVELGNWAVNGFFVASGFLIIGSRSRSTWTGYLWRRVLRIVPAYWAALVVVAAVLAPAAAVLSGDELVWRSAVGYPIRNAFLIVTQPEVANTLTGVPLPHVWLGTAWTLAYEFAAYIAFGALFGIVAVRRHGALIAGAIALGLTVATVALEVPPGASGGILGNSVRLGSYFAIGATAWFLRDKLRPAWWWLPAAAAVILVLWFGLGWEAAPRVAQIPVAVLVLSAGALLPYRIGSRNDISYGIYLYGWPAQQFAVLVLGTTVPILVHSLAAIAAAAGAAWLSWWCVEKPAMRLRSLAGRLGQ